MSELTENLFEGLKALSESAFPKYCKSCGKSFETAEQFMAETKNINQSSGLKTSQDNGVEIIEAFRNCTCGSTLMDFFSDRRDISEKGLERRKKFGNLLELFEKAGEDKETIRLELIKALKGEHSEILAKYHRK